MRRVREDSPVQIFCIKNGQKVTSGPHPAKSSSGRLFHKDTTILYSLSSHSLKQWGQLGERSSRRGEIPEGGASRWLV